MSNINWTIKDENIFNSKLRKLGLVRFTIEVEKALADVDISYRDFEYLLFVLNRLADMNRKLKSKEDNKKKFYKYRRLF